MKGFKYIPLLFVIITLGSCQKVINVKVSATTSQYVVEGNVTNTPGPYTISITKSVNYDQDNTFPGVSGATVFIIDSNTNLTDTLSEMSAGNYQTHLLTGIPGHTYLLNIVSGGNRFFSSSTMPQPISLDSIYTQTSIFGGDTDVVAVYQDPVALGNYYHFQLTIGDSLSQGIYISRDLINNGKKISATLGNNINLGHGDTIGVVLQCIDYNVYQYYSDLQQTEDQNSAAPANPQSNITGGALGYFSAHTVSKKHIVFP